MSEGQRQAFESWTNTNAAMNEPRGPTGQPSFGGDMASRAPGGDPSRDDRLLSPNSRTRLEGWQASLSGHFARLAAARRESGWPVFALEHGLDTSERDALMRDVRACASGGPARDISLPWVVYASEIGYAYSGYEYWQTFESETPGWHFPWREQIRTRFEAFATAYHGASPDGDWARHFNIIAWPITHGILPRDLQRQLAALLYEASMSFRAETFSSAESLGLHLQVRCDGCSSRFRQFAENQALLGQIALALLLHQESGDLLGSGEGAILHARTLGRIIDDLNRERDARHWLAEARSAARFRVRGLARIPARRATDTGRHVTRRRAESDDGTNALPRPRFVLRETAADNWQLRLQLPNLAHLLGRFPRARDVLTRAQGRVGGPTGALLARGRIVSDASPTVILNEWPAPETPLLSFDGAPPELEAVLNAGFRMDARDRWLFLIGSDGQAHEMTTRVLRAGESYLLLERTETRNPVAGFGLRVIQLAASGVHGLRIEMPNRVPLTLIEMLATFGLEVAQTLEVWPVGLPALEWTGDGRAEWVAGHPVVLAVQVERRVARLTLTIDGLEQAVITPTQDAPGTHAFVQLPALGPGQHRLAVVAHTAEDARGGGHQDASSSELKGELQFAIREPRTSVAGQVGPLSFVVHPSTPSLEDVWEDRVELHVAAPGTPAVRCRMLLRDPSGQELFGRTFSLPSPCDSVTWRRVFTAVRRGAEDHYDEAQLCMLDFDAGTLGHARVVAERDFTALRWAVRGNGHRAFLIDSEGSTDLTVHTILCAAPSVEHRRAAAEALEGIDVDDGGALVIARSGGFEAAMVVVPPQRVRGFAELSGQRPHVPTGSRDTATIAALARMTGVWERARLAGSSLAGIRRASAVEALVSSLIGIVAGARWVEAEEVLHERGSRAAAELMRGLVATRPDERAAAVVLSERFAAVAESPIAEAEGVLVNALHLFVRVPDFETLARYALRLAASPSQARAFVEVITPVPDDAAASERRLIDQILARPVILRAARYLVVATRALLTTRGGDLHSLPWST